MVSKSGYVTIIGLPNAGKSTLMNCFLGEKLSIINKKPQTTRKRILGILDEPEYQIIFLDTPGILKPNYLLQERMFGYILRSIQDADVIIYIVDCTNKRDVRQLFESTDLNNLLAKTTKPKFLVLNKIDLSNQEELNKIVEQVNKSFNFGEIFRISAKENFNIDKLFNELIENIPVGQKFYPEGQLSSEPERFFVSEIIREKILELYQDELPYSCEILIDEFKERENRKDYILASIIVEKDTQKQIIIGKGGKKIKEVGSRSRKDIEQFLDRPVYLELRVKIRKNWRQKSNFLDNFGYTKS